MQPIDYTRGFQPVDIAGNLTSGFNLGAGVRDELLARQKAEQDQIKTMQRQAQYERALFDTFNDPTPQNLAKLQIQFPERVKEFQTGFDTLDKARVDDEKKFIGQLYASMRSDPEVSKKLLTDRITALEAGKEDASEEKAALAMLESDPKRALGYVGSLAAFTLPKEQIEALTKLGGEERAAALAPAELAAAEAKAAAAQTEAVQAPLRFQFDMAKIQADIAAQRENTRLRAIEAQIKREENADKRAELTLKRDEAQRVIDEKLGARAADLDAGLSSISDARQIVSELLANPDAVRQATGGLSARSMVPGSTARDVATKVERLQNTLAAANLDKLKGAMSDKDLMFLTNISSSLDRSQSEAAFLKELERIGKTLDRSEQQVLTRFGAQRAVPAVAQSQMPAANQGAPDIEALLRKYGAQ